MKFAIENFIKDNNAGLFLLDSPTGFGKTFAVKKILKEFLSGDKYQDIERMFFVTNLKTNLPHDELCEELTDEEKKECVRIKAFDEEVIDNWGKEEIIQSEITKSKEFLALKADIEIYRDLECEKREIQQTGPPSFKKQRAINGFERKIATITEPAFRAFLRKNYFDGKSVVEKKKFIRDNAWFRSLYPIAEMESKKVIFMTTAKFFSPISVFYRMPFFMYDDSFIRNSVIYIDEFDATKQTVLDQIVENCLKIHVDIISLFTNIYYVLQGLKFPKKFLENSKKQNDDNLDGELKLYTSSEVIDLNREKFKDIYEKHNFDLLLKSADFNNSRAFLFDDGNNITVYTDNSKKYLSVKEDRQENYIKLTAESRFIQNASLNELLWDVQDCIRFFAKGVKFLSNNYFYGINTNKQGLFKYTYTQDEALMTVLSAFNLNGENRNYIKGILTDGRYSIGNSNNITRKGFRFIEVEDSNYHDLHSVAHQFNFETIPENLIVMLAEKARLVGISATATMPTVIGNYDLKYIAEVLGDKYVKISLEDKNKIERAFAESQNVYEQVQINVSLIDDLDTFSNKEKAQILLKQIYRGKILEKYLELSESQKIKEYYFLIMVKLAYLYNEVGKKNIKSFIAFQNRLPKDNNDKVDLLLLRQMFLDVCQCNHYERFSDHIINSDNFDDEMERVYSELADGKKCFVISTYRTVGSGKNIQYQIPEGLENGLIINENNRKEKDFDGIYLATPTNLTQRLEDNSDNKYKDLATYLYQQQSLYLNDKITNGQYRQNVVSGFRKIFFSDNYALYYNKNSDMCFHTTQIAVQAIGRICRCLNKNKQIYIYADTELLERTHRIKNHLQDRLFNKEFIELLNTRINTQNRITVQDYSKKNKNASWKIKQNAYTVRSSAIKVREWQELRNYVLQNPTTDTVPDKYEELYFKFATKTNGFSYRFDGGLNITDLKLGTSDDMIQVSMQDCELPILLSNPSVKKLFYEERYKNLWGSNCYIMTPSLYNQVYKGALGEVVGRRIIEEQIGWDLDEIDDYTLYEYFDYKCKNLYFDFKHWKLIQRDPKTYIDKIKRKLNKVKGEKCIVVNLVKRGKHITRVNIDEDVVMIPYIIDPVTNEISYEMIQEIEKHILDGN